MAVFRDELLLLTVEPHFRDHRVRVEVEVARGHQGSTEVRVARGKVPMLALAWPMTPSPSREAQPSKVWDIVFGDFAHQVPCHVLGVSATGADGGQLLHALHSRAPGLFTKLFHAA